MIGINFSKLYIIHLLLLVTTYSTSCSANNPSIATKVLDLEIDRHHLKQNACFKQTLFDVIKQIKPPKLKSKTAKIRLTKLITGRTHALIGVGSPPQLLNVLFDTGSVDVILRSRRTKDGHNYYDKRKSSSHLPDGGVYYGTFPSYLIFGKWASDHIDLGQNLQVKNQKLVEMDSIEGAPFQFEGIIGLSFNSFFNRSSLLENMAERKLVDKPVMSMFHEPIKWTIKNKYEYSPFGGELMFGGIDWKWIKEGEKLRYVKLVNSFDGWEIQMEGVSVIKEAGDKRNKTVAKYCKGGCRVTVDTGSVMIQVPEYEMAHLVKVLGATQESVIWVVKDCHPERLPNIELTINKHNFTLEPYQYTLFIKQADGSLWCQLLLKDYENIDYEDMWILGCAFIAQYYTVFDYGMKRIGFAPVQPRPLSYYLDHHQKF